MIIAIDPVSRSSKVPAEGGALVGTAQKKQLRTTWQLTTDPRSTPRTRACRMPRASRVMVTKNPCFGDLNRLRAKGFLLAALAPLGSRGFLAADCTGGERVSSKAA